MLSVFAGVDHCFTRVLVTSFVCAVIDSSLACLLCCVVISLLTCDTLCNWDAKLGFLNYLRSPLVSFTSSIPLVIAVRYSCKLYVMLYGFA